MLFETQTARNRSLRSLRRFIGKFYFNFSHASLAQPFAYSFFTRMRANATPATIQRFVDSADLYTQAILQQTVNRSADEVPTVEEFIQLRRDTSAVKMVFGMSPGSLQVPAEFSFRFHSCTRVFSWP